MKFTIREAKESLDVALDRKIITPEVHKEGAEALKAGDLKKFNQVLEKYGVKQQFYQILEQVQKEQQSRQQTQKATADSVASAAGDMFANLDSPLTGGYEEGKEYNKTLEDAKKSGENTA